MATKISCSTKTFIISPIVDKGKINNFSFDNYKDLLPNFYTTNFRNCVMKKVDDGDKLLRTKSIKLYSTCKFQITGTLDKEEILEVLNKSRLKLVYNYYDIICVISNWTFKISEKKIDLEKTMEEFNRNNFIAYFQMSAALIVKTKKTYLRNKFILNANENKFDFVECEYETSNVTLLIYTTGKCIMMFSKMEYYCTSIIEDIKKHIIYC